MINEIIFKKPCGVRADCQDRLESILKTIPIDFKQGTEFPHISVKVVEDEIHTYNLIPDCKGPFAVIAQESDKFDVRYENGSATYHLRNKKINLYFPTQ